MTVQSVSAEMKRVAEAIATKIQSGRDVVSDSELEQLSRVLETPLSGQDTVLPFLDQSFLRSGNIPPDAGRVTLVRYRGMVQDMLDSEFYLSQVDGVQTKYRDYYNPENNLNSAVVDHSFLEERQLLFMTPIPFETKAPNRHVRREPTAATLPTQTTTTLRENKKRSKEQVEEESAPSPVRKQPVLIPNDVDISNKASTTTPTSVTSLNDDSTRTDNNCLVVDTDNWWPAGCMGSDPEQSPVLAKMYYNASNNTKQHTLKLNQVVDMIGVLSLNPLDADFEDGGDTTMLDSVVLPPPSRLPRLHVLCFQEVDLANVMKEPQLSQERDVEPMMTEESIMEDGDARDLRAMTMDALSKHVFGQTNKTAAADALLMVLMSKAERELVKTNEQDGGTYCPIQRTQDSTLGCASLKLVLPNQEACDIMLERLQCVLNQLVPVVAVIDISSKDALRVPAKNEFGRLVPSPLQLPKGSVILIHNGYATNGHEETWGALSSLTKSHVVPYTFDGGVQYNFEADYNVIVLSTKSASRKLDCTLSMKVPLVEKTPTMIPDDVASSIQSYLCQCRGSPSSHGANNIGLSKHVLDVAQDDFIKRRGQQRNKPQQPQVGEEDFHRWLTLTRLQARSRVGLDDTQGESRFSSTVDDWKASLCLDDAMRSS